MNNITKCFWTGDLIDNNTFVESVKNLVLPFGDNGTYAGDNLIVFGRNLSFLSDDHFMQCFRQEISDENFIGHGILWRLYVHSWAARVSMKRDGDFVECGVSSGTCSSIMLKYTDFKSVNKKLYLYDSWGLDHRVDPECYGHDSSTYDYVKSKFNEYKNVFLVPGFIPETFISTCPKKISFLHIDLNSASAEIAVLNHLYERVDRGGIILFDDFGYNGYAESQKKEIEWMNNKDNIILELPTGQGFCIKI